LKIFKIKTHYQNDSNPSCLILLAMRQTRLKSVISYQLSLDLEVGF